MRRLVIAALLALTGCATAVSDSLERRGVTPEEKAMEQAAAAGETAARAGAALQNAGAAMKAVANADAATIGQRTAALDAACSAAARDAQELRIDMRAAQSAGGRWLNEWERQSQYDIDDDTRQRNAVDLGGARSRFDRLMADFARAADTADKAVALCNIETEFLGKNPGPVAAASRRNQRAAFAEAVADAQRRLNAAKSAAASFAAGLK
ncbi:MAG: DUF2959 family protein [Amphiplicatus sp.]